MRIHVNSVKTFSSKQLVSRLSILIYSGKDQNLIVSSITKLFYQLIKLPSSTLLGNFILKKVIYIHLQFICNKDHMYPLKTSIRSLIKVLIKISLLLADKMTTNFYCQRRELHSFLLLCILCTWPKNGTGVPLESTLVLHGMQSPLSIQCQGYIQID